MDQKCKVKVKRKQGRGDCSTLAEFVISYFVKRFLIRTVSIIIFRCELFLHTFYECLTMGRERDIFIADHATNSERRGLLTILGVQISSTEK